MKGLLIMMLPMAVAILTALYMLHKDKATDTFDERDIYK